MEKKVRDILYVTLGSFITAIGFNTMFVHNNIASGGMVGISVVIKELLGISPSLFLMVSNIPLLLLCYFFLGKQTFVKTLYGSWIYPIAIRFTSFLPTLTHNQLLAAIFGGIIVGIGLGMVFWGNSSTGGTGILTQILHKHSPLTLGVAMTIVDGISVLMGFMSLSADDVMYSTIGLLVIGYVISVMENGFDSSKNIMIISREYLTIKDYITKVMDRGVTKIPIRGGYTTSDKVMLMTVVSTYELPSLQEKILEIDDTAFLVVMPAAQVMGRGFSVTKQYKREDEDILLPM
ncbi:membrane protein [Streptococcus porcinus]|uniref:YitT family protein n=1 Tax=Streptococcus porcinus TaxID=1340 RepID=A0A4V0A2U0_STRPO|nr:YitT family protein [Streptococcus porcinus]MBA2795526.1 YitT family protein [Streptococcus porcinus]VTS47855.1 membrane protein [Streptococcus porcinus]